LTRIASALASIFYPIGVSLYSVALVAYPALLAPASSAAERGRQAGWLYAIAGWSGSAMGIGMGQNLGYVPPLFVLAAGAVILLPWLLNFLLQRKRELALTAAVLLAAFYLIAFFPAVRAALRRSPRSSEAGRFISPKAASTATPNLCARILAGCFDVGAGLRAFSSSAKSVRPHRKPASGARPRRGWRPPFSRCGSSSLL
jgi:hypothetical protein